ncbi:S9 family peptidase [Capnocytophaga sp. ARDL2]|uniref:S9 family peptidase n=1 Tax=Capnocytophaga sp. ARDL2 TaxID=3238809 RepID=UPI003558A26F
MNIQSIFTLFVLLLGSAIGFSQNEITVEQIWGGKFQPKTMQDLQSLPKSNQYVVLERNGLHTEINVYDFLTQQKVYTAFSNEKFPQVTEISNIQFSEDENLVLFATNYAPIYRHSFTSIFYIYNRTTEKLIKISNSQIQEPTINPQGTHVAFVFQNNLHILDLNTLQTDKITTDGKKNHIVNGITDWVYEEEFGFVRAFEWNKSGTTLAYIKFDESQVPEFSMNVYGKDLYPKQEVFKYPKAGEKNAKVSLHLYDIEQKLTKNIDFSSYNDFYIPRIKWTNDSDLLSVQILNRHQNELNFNLVNAKTLKKEIIIKETDKAYVDIHDNLTFLNDNSFIWTSEKSGYNHLYHYSIKGKLIKQITDGNWEVTQYYGLNEKTKTIYYQSVERGSIYRDVYSISLNGKNKKLLSKNKGTNSAVFNSQYTHYINKFSSTEKAPSYDLADAIDGKLLKNLVSNQRLEEIINGYRLPKKKFFTIKNELGHDLNAYMIQPTNKEAGKKYPLLMFQYSGPGSQQVADTWLSGNDLWHQSLAQQGYAILCVDGRGTGYKGADFKKCTQKELGKYEVEDQIFVAKQMAQREDIDESRIGIWGWSFGGFMSSNCLFQANEVFKTAIAVAPVTSWRFYDTIYTERFMTTPQENPSGYDENSPITHAHKLKGNYLLIHGTADDNVHVQNAMVLINKLVHQNKNFDWLIYPDKNHGIYGGFTRVQLYNKMTDFILQKL